MKVAVTAFVALLLMTACLPVPIPSDCEAPCTNNPYPDLAPEETETRRKNLIGKWHYHEQRPDGTIVNQTAAFANDGTFEFEFLVQYQDGSTWETKDIGFWGVSGDIYFVITRERSGDEGRFSNSPEEPSNYLAYRILELNESVFRYQTVVTGNVFEAYKVLDTFSIHRNPL